VTNRRRLLVPLLQVMRREFHAEDRANAVFKDTYGLQCDLLTEGLPFELRRVYNQKNTTGRRLLRLKSGNSVNMRRSEHRWCLLTT